MIVPLSVPPFQFDRRASALQTAVLCWLDSSNEARDDGGGVCGALDIAIRKSAKEIAQAASMRHIVVDPPLASSWLPRRVEELGEEREQRAKRSELRGPAG